MNVIAIDQSTKSTGYAIFQNDNLSDTGVYLATGELINRIHYTKEYLKELIQKNKIDYVFIEDIQYQKNQKTYKILANLQGVIQNMLVELNVPFIVVPPSVWKSYNEIKGRKREEQKRNTIEKCEDIYKRSFKEDEADAVMIGVYGLNVLKSELLF